MTEYSHTEIAVMMAELESGMIESFLSLRDDGLRRIREMICTFSGDPQSQQPRGITL